MKVLLKIAAFAIALVVAHRLFFSNSGEDGKQSSAENSSRSRYGINPEASLKDKERVLALVREKFPLPDDFEAQYPPSTAKVFWGVATGYPGDCEPGTSECFRAGISAINSDPNNLRTMSESWGVDLDRGLVKPLPELFKSTFTDYRRGGVVIEPYDIASNPYKLRGQHGILDTTYITSTVGGMAVARTRYPGGALKLEKMIDEHTAIYSILTNSGGAVVPGDEIAVEVQGSEPPAPGRPWMIYVDGPLEGTNGFGAKMRITEVTFEGYYVPRNPAVSAEATAQPSASPPPNPEGLQP